MDAALTPDDVVILNRSTIIARTLAAAAHSVNNSLLVISGTVELLEMGPGPSDAVASALTRIRTQTEAAADVIREVMLFARAALDGDTCINLHDVAEQAVTMRRFATKRAGCQLSLVPSADGSLPVRANPALLLQAMLNLVVNAEEAVAGTKGAAIQIETGRDETHARVRVSDTGGGVPAELRERIFEPWVSTRNRREHSGLGLPASRHIVERYGGTVALGADGGAFVLSLPLASSGG